MIPRYSRPQMADIWTPETRFSIWLEIETLAMEALADLGTIPRSAAEAYRAKGKFEVARIDEIEREVKHDVIAFLTNVAEHVGPESRFAHQGMTSSDVLDTCLSVQLARASDLLIEGVERVLAALKKRAYEYKLTPTIGRSHGIHVRLEAGWPLRRVRAQSGAFESSARGNRDVRDIGRGWHLRTDRSAR
jgi:adenylosuccinate lyase